MARTYTVSRLIHCLLATALLVATPAWTQVSESSPRADPREAGVEAETWSQQHRVQGSDRRRLAELAVALVDRGWQEDPDLTLPAPQAFARRSGNCISFAFLLASLARSHDLPVHFAIRQDDSREARGGLEIARAHLAVALTRKQELIVFDLSGRHDGNQSNYQLVSDGEALGLFYSNLGVAQLVEGKLSLAVDTLREATRRAPDLAPTWINLGVALRRAGRISEAESAYRRAIQLAPESASAWRNLALLLDDASHSDG